MMRLGVALTVGALAALLAGCSQTPPEASPSPSGVTYDEYRAANLDFVACVEAHGGTVKVNEIDSWGVPDISNTVTGPKLTAEPGTAEYDAQIDAFSAMQDECDKQTVAPVRLAYQTQAGLTGQQQETKAKRVEDALPALRECFAKVGVDVDSTSTLDELRTAYHDNADANLDQCFVDLGLATDLGDGSYEIDF